MDLRIEQGDITGCSVEAIVNAANSSLLGGGGVDGAIHRVGGPAILQECRRLRRDAYPDGLPTGDAVATTAGELHARHVIHTVGPVYSTSQDRSELLRSCYRRSLEVADGLGDGVVAFPLVSAGIYGWPKDDAVRQALAGLAAYEGDVVTEVVLVLFDEPTAALARRVVGSTP